jgi:hypothetical protein
MFNEGFPLEPLWMPSVLAESSGVTVKDSTAST